VNEELGLRLSTVEEPLLETAHMEKKGTNNSFTDLSLVGGDKKHNREKKLPLYPWSKAAREMGIDLGRGEKVREARQDRGTNHKKVSSTCAKVHVVDRERLEKRSTGEVLRRGSPARP